jgi:steroid 5-alpha reductase family enzyme
MKKWYLEFEQVILFFSVITYLMSFMFIFDEQMRSTNWMVIVWFLQFVILGTALALYGIKKGWKWPER